MSFNIFKSSAYVICLTVLSKSLGIVREVIMAATFGAGGVADVISIAFRVPNLFRRMMSDGALFSVFIPMYNNMINHSQERANRFANSIFWILLIVIVLIMILMELNMKSCILFLAPGFAHNSYKMSLSILLCKISVVYLIFVFAYTLLGGVLNARGKFFAFTIAPSILSLHIIFSALIAMQMGLSVEKSSEFLMYGSLISGFVQVIFLLICISKHNLNFLSVRYFAEKKEVSKFFYSVLPAFFTSGFVQIQIFTSNIIMSFLEGGIAIMGYTEKLYLLPLSLFGINFANVALSKLSELKKSDTDTVNGMQNLIMRVTFLCSSPIAILISVLSNCIVHIVYERGNFLSSDTLHVSNCLQIFCYALPAISCIKVLNNIFYIHYKNRQLLYISTVFLLFNLILNLYFVFCMKLGFVSVGMGTVISAWAQLVVMLVYLHKQKYFSLEKFYLFYICKVISICIIIGIICNYLKKICFNFDSALWLKIIVMFFILCICFIIYMLLAIVLGAIKIKSKKIIF